MEGKLKGGRKSYFLKNLCRAPTQNASHGKGGGKIKRW
jgi:hypothetical protein